MFFSCLRLQFVAALTHQVCWVILIIVPSINKGIILTGPTIATSRSDLLAICEEDVAKHRGQYINIDREHIITSTYGKGAIASVIIASTNVAHWEPRL